MICVGPTFSVRLNFILVVLLHYFKLSPPAFQYNKRVLLSTFSLWLDYIFIVLFHYFILSSPTIQYTHQEGSTLHVCPLVGYYICCTFSLFQIVFSNNYRHQDPRFSFGLSLFVLCSNCSIKIVICTLYFVFSYEGNS